MKNLLQFFTSLLLFLLPWQTIYITQEQFLNGSKWQYGTLGFYASEILLWICIFLFMVWFLKEKKTQIAKVPRKFLWTKDRFFILSILLFSLYAFASVLWAEQTSVAEQSALHIMEAFLLFFVLFLGPLQWHTAVKCFVVGACVQSVLAIFQFWSQSTFALKWFGLVSHPLLEAGSSVVVGEGIGRVLRAYGSFSHPNVLGGFLAVSIILSTIFLFQEGEKENSTKKTRYYFYAKWYGVLSLQIVGLFFTFSRSAWIATIIWFLGIFVVWSTLKIKNYAFLQNKFHRMLSLCLFAFILSLLLCFQWWSIVETRFVHHSSHEIQSTQERVVGIQEALTLWKQRPLLGVGAGNFTLALFEQNPTRPGYEYQPVHNVFLLILSELGVLGFLLFCFVYCTMWISVMDQFRKKKGVSFFLLLISLSVLALASLDHYLVSSFEGLLLLSVYFALILRFIPILSPLYPEEKVQN